MSADAPRTVPGMLRAVSEFLDATVDLLAVLAGQRGEIWEVDDQMQVDLRELADRMDDWRSTKFAKHVDAIDTIWRDIVSQETL